MKMMTTTTTLATFHTLSVLEVNHSNLSTVHTTPHSPQLLGLLMSCFTMTFGTISNIVALVILAKSRAKFRGQSKAPFLLLTVALLLADLGGHSILGAFALHIHLNSGEINSNFCDIFGGSMVFFGLCPLILGCAMAVERWVAINRPFLHLSISVAHVKRVVLLLTSSALVLALLPFFTVGKYTVQFPQTWCFLPIHDSQSTADKSLILAFLVLGLTSLIVSLLCNILSGLSLLKARIRSRNRYTTSAAHGAHYSSPASCSPLFCSLDVEMLVQLVAVTVVSCVCWGPFLIIILLEQLWSPPNQKNKILGLRMAAWNQILDPWVYILLRRTLLSKLCCSRVSIMTPNDSFTGSRRETISLQ